MKKKIPLVCNIAAVILVVAFVVKCIVDYTRYNPLATSAPFSVEIGVNALLLAVPALIIFIVGLVIGRKQK